MKDNKNPNTNGKFTTRLVIPETRAFPKVGYLGLKSLLENHQVNYKNTR